MSEPEHKEKKPNNITTFGLVLTAIGFWFLIPSVLYIATVGFGGIIAAVMEGIDPAPGLVGWAVIGTAAIGAVMAYAGWTLRN